MAEQKYSANMLSQRKIRQRNELWFKIGFSAPGTLIYTGIMVVPIFFSLYYSLLKWDGVGRQRFVGINNYVKLFTSANYAIITKNTLILVACSLLITTALALVTAYLIYRTKVGFKLFRSSVFIPVILSPIVIGLIFSIILNADMGPFNELLRQLGLGSWARSWLGDTKTVLGAVIVPQIWQNTGYYTIIFLAGMQSIPTELEESAYIDGANSFTVFMKIVLPLITNITQIIIILIVTSALKSFGFAWIMTKGGPGVQSSFFTVYLYTKAFLESDFGLSSTISVNVLVYAIAFTLLFKWVMKRINRLT